MVKGGALREVGRVVLGGALRVVGCVHGVRWCLNCEGLGVWCKVVPCEGLDMWWICL